MFYVILSGSLILSCCTGFGCYVYVVTCRWGSFWTSLNHTVRRRVFKGWSTNWLTARSSRAGPSWPFCGQFSLQMGSRWLVRSTRFFCFVDADALLKLVANWLISMCTPHNQLKAGMLPHIGACS